MPRTKLPTCDPDLKAPPELVCAVQQADVKATRALLEKDPHLVWADHLIHWDCRVPGYQGHGGSIPAEEAKQDQRVEIIRIFLAHGADPSMRNKRKVTPLHMSSRFGLRDVAEALLEGGADPNATDEVRETPLYRAVNLGYADVTKVLLEHRADPNVDNRKGHTTLHRAVIRGKVAIVPLLLEHGAAVKAEDREGKTPIDYARNKEIRAFLEGAD
jgi:ankyrin repeat protein